MQRNRSRARLGAAALAVSGISFVLYPAIRPFSDEMSMQGAAAFASTEWLVAHMLAMVAFTLLAVGLPGLHSALEENRAERLALRAVMLSVVGVGLTLPFYGGEAFGLHAIGQEAIQQQSVALVSLASVFRSGAGLVMFLVGIILLALSTITAATAIWRSGSFARWSGIPFAPWIQFVHSAVWRDAAGPSDARIIGGRRVPVDGSGVMAL